MQVPGNLYDMQQLAACCPRCLACLTGALPMNRAPGKSKALQIQLDPKKKSLKDAHLVKPFSQSVQPYQLAAQVRQGFLHRCALSGVGVEVHQSAFLHVQCSASQPTSLPMPVDANTCPVHTHLQVEYARHRGVEYGDDMFVNLARDIFHLCDPTTTPRAAWVQWVSEDSDLKTARDCIAQEISK